MVVMVSSISSSRLERFSGLQVGRIFGYRVRGQLGLLTIAPSYSILSIEAGGAGAEPPCGYLSQARWACLYARWLFLRANFGELRVCELRRILLPRTSVNKCRGLFEDVH